MLYCSCTSPYLCHNDINAAIKWVVPKPPTVRALGRGAQDVRTNARWWRETEGGRGWGAQTVNDQLGPIETVFVHYNNSFPFLVFFSPPDAHYEYIWRLAEADDITDPCTSTFASGYYI